jgi:hypothetical protein
MITSKGGKACRRRGKHATVRVEEPHRDKATLPDNDLDPAGCRCDEPTAMRRSEPTTALAHRRTRRSLATTAAFDA